MLLQVRPSVVALSAPFSSIRTSFPRVLVFGSSSLLLYTQCNHPNGICLSLASMHWVCRASLLSGTASLVKEKVLSYSKAPSGISSCLPTGDSASFSMWCCRASRPCSRSGNCVHIIARSINSWSAHKSNIRAVLGAVEPCNTSIRHPSCCIKHGTAPVQCAVVFHLR